MRTKPELLYVGKVPGSVAVEWQTYPGSRENPEFLAELAAAVPKDTPVMFLCRSGARSNAAAEAATRAGWKEAYNVLEGFEGDKDADAAPQLSRRLAQGRPAVDPKLNSGSGRNCSRTRNDCDPDPDSRAPAHPAEVRGR